MIQAGNLDRRITVERFTATEDALGGQVKTWVPLATVWGQARPVSDGERFRAGEMAAEIDTRFTIRWGLGVGPKDRIVYGGRVYEIRGVKEIGRREGQEISAAARAD